MKKQIFSPEKAPPAAGPYSQAVAAGPFVFLSGQIPLNAEGQLVKGDIVVQTVQVLENVKAVLAATGLTLKEVVKTTVFLADLADFQEMNRAYAEFFPEKPPARSTIQVAALPKGAAVEIEVVALRKDWPA
jgi:2-iminobutanoate/2-iminopropanoate deaminase